MDGHIVKDEGNLVDFSSHQANQDYYCIVDEHGIEYSIEDFLKKIKYNGAWGTNMLMDAIPSI